MAQARVCFLTFCDNQIFVGIVNLFETERALK